MFKYYVGVEIKNDDGTFTEVFLKSNGTYSNEVDIKDLALFYSYGDARDASHRLASKFSGNVRPYVKPVTRLKSKK